MGKDNIRRKSLGRKTLASIIAFILLAHTRNGEDHYISAFAPLYDEQGSVAAFVCVTRPELEIGAIISQFILGIFLAAAIVSAIIMLIVYRLIKRDSSGLSLP